MKSKHPALKFLAKEFDTDINTMRILCPSYNWRRNFQLCKALTNRNENLKVPLRAIQSINSITQAEEIIPDKLRTLALQNIPNLDITLTPRILSVKTNTTWYRQKLISNDSSDILYTIPYALMVEKDEDLTALQEEEAIHLVINMTSKLLITVALIKHVKISQALITGR